MRRPGRRHHHAYLTDRVLLVEGDQHRYGTQIMLVGGTWQSRPLADPQHVDDRRRQIRLEPLADYLRRFERLYPKGVRTSSLSDRTRDRRDEGSSTSLDHSPVNPYNLHRNTGAGCIRSPPGR